jgi:hypothetical protein
MKFIGPAVVDKPNPIFFTRIWICAVAFRLQPIIFLENYTFSKKQHRHSRSWHDKMVRTLLHFYKLDLTSITCTIPRSLHYPLIKEAVKEEFQFVGRHVVYFGYSI